MMTNVDSNGQKADATIRDVAEHFGVSTRTVRRWLKSTDIPHRRIGDTIRFKLPEVDEWAAQRVA